MSPCFLPRLGQIFGDEATFWFQLRFQEIRAGGIEIRQSEVTLNCSHDKLWAHSSRRMEYYIFLGFWSTCIWVRIIIKTEAGVFNSTKRTTSKLFRVTCFVIDTNALQHKPCHCSTPCFVWITTDGFVPLWTQWRWSPLPFEVQP